MGDKAVTYSNGKMKKAGDTGTVDFDGNVNLGNANTDNIVFIAEVDSDIVPDDSATYSLGSPSKAWNNLYASSLYATSVTSSNDFVINAVGGDIKFQDNGTTVFVIEDGGNVGIGSLVPNPSYLLHLKKNTMSPMIYIDSIASDNTDFIYAKSSFDTDPDSGSYLLRWVDAIGDTLFYIKGNGSGGSTYSSSFTAGHDTILPADENVVPGFIVESTGEVWYKPTDKNFETALPRCRVCRTAKSPKIFGVIGGIPNVLDGTKAAESGRIINGNLQAPAFPSYGRRAGVAENEVHLNLMSIGEGVVWITNKNGDIGNGDLIVSSNVVGHGELQDDDIFRSCTVAKCTEAIDWESVTETVDFNGVPYKKYLCSCTFHCG
jgi:hypothetical protein